MALRRGAKGKNVGTWQQYLLEAGYRVTVDDDFGPLTERETRRWQSEHQLEATGVVDAVDVNKAKTLGFRGFQWPAAPAPAQPGNVTIDLSQAENVTVTLPEDATIIPKPTPKSDKLILVSAGHSNVPPRDPGAVGNGYTESIEAVRLRDAVADRLRLEGYTVIEDGADGVNDPLRKAVVLAKRSDVAIELHWNAGTASATGIEVLSKPNKKRLAQQLAGAIHRATGIKIRGESGWKADNSGQHHRLAFCEAGGLIVEVCFISNREDILRYKENFGSVADNIAEVLENA